MGEKRIKKIGANSQLDARRYLITGGSLYRSLGVLVWPTIVQVILQMLSMVIEQYMVGRYGVVKGIGPEPLAAISLSRNALMIVFSFAIGINAGISTLVAQYTGRGDYRRATTVAIDAFWFLGIIAFIAFVLGRLYLREFITVYHSSPEVNVLVYDYLIVFVNCMFLVLLSMTVFSMMIGVGDTLTPMIILAVLNISNILFVWILIFGPAIPFLGIDEWGGLGVKGAAIGTVSARILAVVVAVAILFSGRYRLDLRRAERFTPSWLGTWAVLRIGLPTAMQAISRNISVMMLNVIISYSLIHDKAQAALGTGFILEWLPFGPAMAITQASAIIVGQNIGAGYINRAEKAANIALCISAAFMSLVAVFFWFGSYQLARIFTDEEAVIISLASYLRIIGLADIFLAGMIYAGALRAAGDAVSPMVTNASCLWGLRIPLAYVLLNYTSLDYVGVWLAMGISQVVEGFIYVILFRSGRWKKIDLIGKRIHGET